MASDLLNDNSPRVLKQKLEHKVTKIDLPYIPSAKLFLAVAELQKFDALPKVVEKTELDSYIVNGCLELNRGLTATLGFPAAFYARELVHGSLYPGTLTAHGHGMYFAEPSIEIGPNQTASEFLPRRSEVATKYATGEIGGIIMRAALKPKARILSQDNLYERFRNERNRAARAGVEDLGIYAAAIGIDAFYVDGAFIYCNERMWVVLNRAQLVLQRFGLRYYADEVSANGASSGDTPP